jgi:drug/metabolite transporter (DMT)-like permease
MGKNLNSRIWAGMLSIYLIWGSTYLAIRYAVQTIPPLLMAGSRFLVAGLILLTWRRLAGDAFPPRKEIRSAAIVGLFLLLGGNGLVVWAEQRVVSSVTALIIGSVPLFVVVLELFWPGRPRPNWKVLVGVLGGFLGIAILIGPSQLSTSATHIDPLGAIALLFAALFWAIGSIYASQAELPDSPVMGTAVEMLAGAGGLIIIGTLVGEWGRLDLGNISKQSALAFGYLIVFGSLIGFASYSWLLRVAPIALVSTYAYVNPMVAVFLGHLIADEPITWQILLSSGIIIGSVALINSVRFRSMRKLPQPVPYESLDS